MNSVGCAAYQPAHTLVVRGCQRQGACDSERAWCSGRLAGGIVESKHSLSDPDAIAVDEELWLGDSLIVQIGTVVALEILDPPGAISPSYNSVVPRGEWIVNDHVVVTISPDRRDRPECEALFGLRLGFYDQRGSRVSLRHLLCPLLEVACDDVECKSQEAV